MYILYMHILYTCIIFSNIKTNSNLHKCSSIKDALSFNFSFQTIYLYSIRTIKTTIHILSHLAAKLWTQGQCPAWRSVRFPLLLTCWGPFSLYLVSISTRNIKNIKLQKAWQCKSKTNVNHREEDIKLPNKQTLFLLQVCWSELGKTSSVLQSRVPTD